MLTAAELKLLRVAKLRGRKNRCLLARNITGLTQAAVCASLRVSSTTRDGKVFTPAYLGAIERGEVDVPQSTERVLMRFYGARHDDLFPDLTPLRRRAPAAEATA